MLVYEDVRTWIERIVALIILGDYLTAIIGRVCGMSVKGICLSVISKPW